MTSTFAIPLHTAHLTLVLASARHVKAELAGQNAFGLLLGATVPSSWPPGEYDEPAQRFCLDQLLNTGDAGIGWYGWYAIRNADREATATVVASGGFLGPPTEAGLVELGYSVCPEWRQRGYATELARTLTAHAMRQPVVTRVIAHTTAANPASVRVLARSGFSLVENLIDPNRLRFEHT
jgi:RimJ/RimL family protein N-acetyltransferase